MLQVRSVGVDVFCFHSLREARNLELKDGHELQVMAWMTHLKLLAAMLVVMYKCIQIEPSSCF